METDHEIDKTHGVLHAPGDWPMAINEPAELVVGEPAEGLKHLILQLPQLIDESLPLVHNRPTLPFYILDRSSHSILRL